MKRIFLIIPLLFSIAFAQTKFDNNQTTATNAATASVIVARDANANTAVNNILFSYQTIATAAGTTTLTVASPYQTYFTGATTQTLVLPVVSTLVLGQQFLIVNTSTGIVTVNSSGSNLVQSIAASSSAIFTCILTSGTTAASWSISYFPTVTFSTGTFMGDGSAGNPYTLATDATPTASSTFPVQSGGVFTALAGKMTNPMTTTGDIIVGGASGVPARLAIGGANTILHGGSTPAYSAIVNSDITNTTIDLTTKVTGMLPVANGGTGTASPGIVAGTNITVTGTWPNQTVNSSGGGGSVANPTATIGLIAINGSASSAIRSDGASALSQAIAPVWTGFHTFNASTTAVLALGQGTYFNNGVTAAANNDVLIGTDFQNNFIANSKTGLTLADVRIKSNGTSNVNLMILRGGAGNEPTVGSTPLYIYSSITPATVIDGSAPSLQFYHTGTYFSSIGDAGGNMTSGTASDLGIGTSNNIVFSTGGTTIKGKWFSSSRLFIGTSPTDNGTDIIQAKGSIISGIAGTTIGTYNLAGNTSGIISIKPQAAAGTYEFDMPITAGTAGQVLTSQGGAGTAMTWTSTVKGHTIFTPTTGGTVTLVNNQTNVINPAGSLVTLTVNLPSSPANDDRVVIKYTQAITTVTYANGTVVDGITAPTAGGLVVLVYDSGTTSWY